MHQKVLGWPIRFLILPIQYDLLDSIANSSKKYQKDYPIISKATIPAILVSRSFYTNFYRTFCIIIADCHSYIILNISFSFLRT